MSSTPALSKTQQKKAASIKKNLAKGLKNVLVRPDENYWPLLKDDPDSELESLLRRLLPAKKVPQFFKVAIHWSQLQPMSKEERKIARKDTPKVKNEDYNNTSGKYIITGINETTKHLEKDNICCILLDSTLDPIILAKHVVSMAEYKNIPILLISFLKKVSLETIGYACSSIALKNYVKSSPDCDLYPLYEKVSKMSFEFTKFKDSTIVPQVTFLKEEKSCDNVELQNMEVDTEEEIKPCIVSSNVYLQRQSKKVRIFQPPSPLQSKDVQQSMGLGADFIALGNDKFVVDEKKMPSRFFEKVSSNSDDENNKTKKETGQSKVNYKPLKVKRLKGNENRKKATKISKLKK